jgi:hypothetical protein
MQWSQGTSNTLKLTAQKARRSLAIRYPGYEAYMKTYPIKHEDGSLHAFEIVNAWISMRVIKQILNSAPGVSSMKRRFRSDDHLEFAFNGEPWVVNEPWGDSSRYWIGPKNASHHSFDVVLIHDAFVQYQSPLIRLWGFVRRKTSG